jgi:transcription antitermination factor NusG
MGVEMQKFSAGAPTRTEYAQGEYMLSLSENPSILTPEVRSLTELCGTWWIAYTRPRFEKAFARDLCSLGIGYFLPMYEKSIFSGGRYRRLMSPLFASYVFFCGTEQDRHMAMRTNRLCYTVDVADQERLKEELAGIETALLSKAVVDAYPRLPIGSRCRIVSGPMKNIEGVVVEKKCAKARVVIEVTILTQGALVEIDADLLEPLE